MAKDTKKPKKSGAGEYRLWIDAYTPKTMPMARLAEYLVQLATILGEPAHVHFVKLERGSTAAVHHIEPEAEPKVMNRAIAVRRHDAPRDAIHAYEIINRMLRDDNAVGAWQDKNTGAEIIRFPGREDKQEEYAGIRQYGTLDGEVIRIGGPRQWVPVILQVEDQQIANCYAERRLAKELALHFFEPVRLFGKGKWNRDAEGTWVLREFIVQSFEALRDAPLSQIVEELRAIDVPWTQETYNELQVIRHGPPENQNGGS
jgi:hypothetical protein